MTLNICIIHYNTPALTTCLIKSIKMHTPRAKVYLFDNSDTKPFISRFDDVVVFNNTEGQIIDFDKCLNQYPNRAESHGAIMNYASAKHCMSVEKCMELINDNFILLDSDVLLKKDISSLYDDNCFWVGTVEYWTPHFNRKRVCPFLAFLNVRKMKENGIHFFDDKHMFGLNNGPLCEEYDTGGWLLESAPEPNKVIDYRDYIIHFRAGSWLEIARSKHNYKQVDPKEWLTTNKEYWLNEDEKLEKKWFEYYNNEKRCPILNYLNRFFSITKIK